MAEEQMNPGSEAVPSGDVAASAEALMKEAKQAASTVKKYYATIYPGTDDPIPTEFAENILQLEKILEMPILLIIQNSDSGGEYANLAGPIYKAFQSKLSTFAEGSPVGLLIDSPGGDAHYAYRLGRMLQRRTKGRLTVIVPQYAKSAATLLALAACDLILGREAELGPLDVQVLDPERECYSSALDSVRSLERLNASALTAIDQAMFLFLGRTGKRTDVLLPHMLSYGTNLLRPLLEKIDAVDYTRKSRELKVAEEYAVRLMRQNYSFDDATTIARQLVEKYPTHGFVIDGEETNTKSEQFGLGLRTKMHSSMNEMQTIFDRILPYLDSLTIAGRINEVKI